MSRRRKVQPSVPAPEPAREASWPPARPAAAAMLLWAAYALWRYRLKGVGPEPRSWAGIASLAGAVPDALARGAPLALLALAALWAAYWLAGRALGRRLGLPRPEGLEDGLLAAGLGAGALSLALLALGLARLWRPWLLASVFWSALAAAAWRAWRAWGSRVQEAEFSGPPAPRGEWVPGGPLAWGALLLLGASLFQNLIAVAAPEIFYDSLVYHLALPRLYLLRGAIVPTPENLFSGIPFGLQMHFGLALALAGDRLAALLHLSFGAGAALALWAWGRRWASARAGLLAGLLFYLAPLAQYAAWNCGVDLGASFFAALAFCATCRGLGEPERARAWSAAAGLLAGFAMGVKYNVWPLGAALVAVHAWLGRRAGRPWMDALVMAGAAAAAVAPWLAKNLLFYGNPLYPFLHGALGWAAPADWPNFLSAVGSRPLGATFGSWAGLKEVLVFGWSASYSDWPMGDWPGPAYIVLVPWAFASGWCLLRRREEISPALAGAVFLALAGYASWCLASRLVRYVVPALPFIALTAALAVERAPLAPWVRRAGWCAALICCLYNLQVGYRQGLLIGQWDYLLKRMRPREYLAHQRVTYGLPYYSAMEFINRDLPPTARVAFLGESRAYYCERDFVAATVFDRNPFWEAARGAKDADELRRRAGELGITHLFLSARQLLYRHDAAPLFPKEVAGSEAFASFFQRWLDPVFEDRVDGEPDPRWLVVYRLRDAPREPGARPLMNPAQVILDYLAAHGPPLPGHG